MPTSFYEQFFAYHDEAMRAGADAAVAAGLAKMGEILPFVAVPFVVFCALMVAWGAMDRGKMLNYLSGLAVAIWLIQGGAFIPYIRDMALETVPNEYASALHAGTNDRINSVQQFAIVDAAAGHHVSLVLGKATGIFQIGNAFAAWQARGWQKFWLECVFIVWIAMRMVLLLALSILSFLIVFFIFPPIRHWFMSQLTVIVSIVLWQLSASILLKIMLGGVMIYMRNIINEGAGMSIEQQIDQAWSIAGWFFCCFMLLLAVPAVIGIRGGASSAPLVAGAMVSASRSMVSAGQAMQRAARRR